ncbi:MAG: YkgJ family cysteine cluster protein [Pseudomonadota bacterium]
MAHATPSCRPGCGACCTAPSISSPIPGMPGGKPAGVPCVQLDDRKRCRIFGDPRRPAVCSSLQPSTPMCGTDERHATKWLTALEQLTRPGA